MLRCAKPQNGYTAKSAGLSLLWWPRRAGVALPRGANEGRGTEYGRVSSRQSELQVNRERRAADWWIIVGCPCRGLQGLPRQVVLAHFVEPAAPVRGRLFGSMRSSVGIFPGSGGNQDTS